MTSENAYVRTSAPMPRSWSVVGGSSVSQKVESIEPEQHFDSTWDTEGWILSIKLNLGNLDRTKKRKPLEFSSNDPQGTGITDFLLITNTSMMRCSPIKLVVISFWIFSNGWTFGQEGDAIKLLIRSDDMGVAHAVNVACLDSVQNGVARSIEVIVPGPWFMEAVEMLKEHPEIDVGVHLDLTSEWSGVKWGPVSKDVPSLVDENGHFYPTTSQRHGMPPNTGFLESSWKIEEVERELRAQIETAVRLLPNVTHMSAHMGTATGSPRLKALVDRLAVDYQLPIAIPGLKRTGRFGSKVDSFERREAAMVELIEQLKPGLWMLIEHPGLDTPEMRAIGHPGYENVAEDRDNVTKVFTSPKVKAAIERHGVQLVSYADVIAARD